MSTETDWAGVAATDFDDTSGRVYRSIAVQFQPGGSVAAYAALLNAVDQCQPMATWSDAAGNIRSDLAVVPYSQPALLPRLEIITELVTSPSGQTLWDTTGYEFDGDYLSVVSDLDVDEAVSETAAEDLVVAANSDLRRGVAPSDSGT